MPDNDSQVLRDASASVTEIDVRYRMADINDKIKMKPKRDAAFEEYSRARLKLIDEGVLATDEDVREMGDIRRKIEQAAETQQLIVAAGRLVGLLAKFV